MKNIVLLPTILLALFFSSGLAMKKLAFAQTFAKHKQPVEDISMFDEKCALSFSEKDFFLWKTPRKKEDQIIRSKEDKLTAVTKFDNRKILTVSCTKKADGETFISSIKLWDTSNETIYPFEEKEEYGYLNNINTLNNEKIFSHHMGKFIFWDIVTQKFLHTFGKEHVNFTNKGEKTSFCVPNEKTLISLFKKQILVWNAKEKKQIGVFEGHKNSVRTLQNINDTHFVSTDYNDIIKLWDCRMNQCEGTYEGHTYFVDTIVPLNEKKIASCSMAEIIVWDKDSERGLVLFETSDNYVTTIEKIDNKTIASGHKNGQIKLWDIETLDCLRTTNAHRNPVKILRALNSNILLSCCRGSNEIDCWKIRQVD